MPLCGDLVFTCWGTIGQVGLIPTAGGFQGKAMVISIDKATALRMYNKVRENWSMELVRVKQSLELALMRSQQQRTSEIVELEARRATLETTDMALVVSQSQNEIEQ